MIDLENLSDKSALDILYEAGQKIEFLNPKWTYKGESDPGITLLEVLSWLKYDQHEYLNNISRRLKIKLLKLLGIKLKKRTGSKTLIHITNCMDDIDVPARTKWRADSLVFENLDSEFLTKADIISLKFNNPEFSEEQNYYNIGGLGKISIFGDKNLEENEVREFEIRLSNEFPKMKSVSIYFDIYSEYKRNEIISDDFDPFSSVKWQYWGIKNGIAGWHDFDFEDYTYGFLFSGKVILRHYGQMTDVDGIYKIKCQLSDSDYDFMPKISNVRLNIFEVDQRDTKCESVFIKKKKLKIKGESYEFKSNTNLNLYGNSLIYIKKEDSWVGVEQFDCKKNVNNGYCTYKIDKYDLGNYEDEDDVILLISYSDDLKNKIILGDGTGFSGLTFDLSFDDLSVYDEFQIMVGEGNKKNIAFKIWDRVDDFFESSKFDKHFVYEENAKLVAFGDNHRGEIPECNNKNIQFCKLSFTKAGNSNLRENLIGEVESDNLSLRNANIIQIVPAVGGTDDELINDAQLRAFEILKDQRRAVVLDDYIRIIKRTPGLIINDLSVFTSDKANENKVFISVRLPNSNVVPLSYKKNIRKYFENFRLVNTEIEILSPVIIVLNIKIKLTLKFGHSFEEDNMRNIIELFIDKINIKMGQKFVYGDLYKHIEKTDYVDYVNSLEISRNDYKNNINSFHENIIPPMNALYSLGKLEIISIINTNF